MKRCLFIVLALFGLNSFADMHEKGMDHMSNMMGSEGENGLMGSFALRFKPMGFDEKADDLTYRARIGWMGDVNEAVKWAVSFSTATEQNFNSIGLSGMHLEQAYVHYMPMEGLSVRVGKHGWMPDFHKTGVLYSEQLYKTGAMLKYGHMGWYGKVGFYNLNSDPLHKPAEGEHNYTSSDPFNGWTAKLKLGGHFEVADGMKVGFHIAAMNDGLIKSEEATTNQASEAEETEESSEPETAETAEAEETETTTDSSSDSNTLAMVGVHFGMSSMPVPVGVSVNWLANADNIGFNSYAVTFSVGATGKATSAEMGDFGLAVNYYNLSEGDFVGNWLNEDFVNVAGANHQGLAVRGQYNPLDNTSLVLKYAHNLDTEGDAGNLVAELMFVF